MVKVFTTNKNGKIEFTKEELETLLNEVWNDGYYHHGTYWWTSPTITTPLYRDSVITDDHITITYGTGVVLRREETGGE